MFVLGHLLDQQRYQLVDDPMAFFRAIKNGERWQVAYQPEEVLLGTCWLQQQRRQQPTEQDQVA
ncbi:hypothetical protein D3C78_1946710 [compost metagenome]